MNERLLVINVWLLYYIRHILCCFLTMSLCYPDFWHLLLINVMDGFFMANFDWVDICLIHFQISK